MVAIANDTSVRWYLDAARIARGDFVDLPPPTIEPWSAAVCSACSGAARAGAGCAGSARYRSGDGVLLELRFDVPYAGCAVAQIAIGDRPPLAERRPASGTVVFRLHVPGGSDLVSSL